MRSVLFVAGVVLSAGLCTALAAANGAVPAVSRTHAAVERLQAPDWEVRKAAKAEILDIFKELGGSLKQGEQVSDNHEYQQFVDGLISIVRKEREKYQLFFDERVIAIELLGDLRAAKAVEVLLDNILFCPPGFVTEKTPGVIYPCVGALIKIGSPSVQGILNRLDRQAHEMPVLRLYAIVIRRVEEREPGRALLEGELQKATARRANLAQMIPEFAGTMPNLGLMLKDLRPQVRFAAARRYARIQGWPGPAAASSPEERERFVADTLARIEREGSVPVGGAGTEAQPQPKPEAARAPAEWGSQP